MGLMDKASKLLGRGDRFLGRTYTEGAAVARGGAAAEAIASRSASQHFMGRSTELINPSENISASLNARAAKVSMGEGHSFIAPQFPQGDTYDLTNMAVSKARVERSLADYHKRVSSRAGGSASKPPLSEQIINKSAELGGKAREAYDGAKDIGTQSWAGIRDAYNGLTEADGNNIASRFTKNITRGAMYGAGSSIVGTGLGMIDGDYDGHGFVRNAAYGATLGALTGAVHAGGMVAKGYNGPGQTAANRVGKALTSGWQGTAMRGAASAAVIANGIDVRTRAHNKSY